MVSMNRLGSDGASCEGAGDDTLCEVDLVQAHAPVFHRRASIPSRQWLHLRREVRRELRQSDVRGVRARYAGCCLVAALATACGSAENSVDEWSPLSPSSSTTAPTSMLETISPTSTVTSPTMTTSPAPATTTASTVTSTTTAETMEPDPILEALPVTQMRLLTRGEYKNTVSDLLQVDPSELVLPDDTPIAGFGTVGAKAVTVNEVAAESYEKASQAIAISTFSDAARWEQVVGCQPQADLSDSCVDSYVRSFGRRAFRRVLTDEEVSTWVNLARQAATSGEEPSAELGLAAATAGILQSPNFLYRVEDAAPDLELGRIRFDGLSMASRLSYLITGSAPSDELLDAALAGELDDAEGVRTAAMQMLPNASEHMVEFFTELTQLELARKVERNPELFPGVDDELRSAMVEETERWLSEVVLAPGSDFREFFTSRTTFVNQQLAQYYGLPQGGADFQRVTLGDETGRAGIMGKAGFLMAHSSPDSSNPTRRGNFILKSFVCIDVPLPPADLVVTVPKADEEEGPKTTRQLFEAHAIDVSCVGCHQVMDPYGFALEHFDAAGRYRETEEGLEIDAKASLAGDTFDGAIELGEVLRRHANVSECFVKNFYRYANGTADDKVDAELIGALAAGLEQNGFVWRDLLLDFATSDAFTSLAPSVGIPPAAEAEQTAGDSQ